MALRLTYGVEGDVLLLLKNYLQNVIAKGSFKDSKHPSEEKSILEFQKNR